MDKIQVKYIQVWKSPQKVFSFFKKKKTFCGFSMGSNQYWAGRVYDLCVYYMTGLPKAQPKVVLWRSK